MKAFITGITGQDGYYLSKLLLEKGYEVHGTVRRSSNFNTNRIDTLISKYSDEKQLNLYFSDLLDASSLTTLVNKIEPDEIYNLAAQSHVAVSFSNPGYSVETSAKGPLTLLEAVKNMDKISKYYQASSSEMFGGEKNELINENTKLDPKSPYAAGKVLAHNLTTIYRDSYDLFTANGILFNHESPHRGETFVTRKITRAVGRIKYGLQNQLTLGNLDSERDWGFAGDYVEGMWLMLQHNLADDWILATGQSYKVRDFVKRAFEEVELDWEDYVKTSNKYQRPNEVHFLRGDSTKAQEQLGWSPKIDFQGLVSMMVESDLVLAEKEKVLIDKGLLKPTWENYT
jgi:GDPmannose 4,6-dehydratase